MDPVKDLKKYWKFWLMFAMGQAVYWTYICNKYYNNQNEKLDEQGSTQGPSGKKSITDTDDKEIREQNRSLRE